MDKKDLEKMALPKIEEILEATEQVTKKQENILPPASGITGPFGFDEFCYVLAREKNGDGRIRVLLTKDEVMDDNQHYWRKTRFAPVCEKYTGIKCEITDLNCPYEITVNKSIHKDR